MRRLPCACDIRLRKDPVKISSPRRGSGGRTLVVKGLKIVKDMTQCHCLPFSITPRDGG
jgi:hypothetical protein